MKVTKNSKPNPGKNKPNQSHSRHNLIKSSSLVITTLLINFSLTGCSLSELETTVMNKLPIIQETEITESSNSEALAQSVIAPSMVKTTVTEQSNNIIDESDYNWYYKNLTSQTSRDIYNKIYETLINFEPAAEFDNIDINVDEMTTIYKCVAYDHPEIFYVSSYKFTKYSLNNSQLKVVFIPIYNMTEDKVRQAQREIEEYTSKIIAEANKLDSDYEKEKYIYDYIATNTEYVEDSLFNQSLYSVVKGESVCMGYTRMFQYIANRVGLPCTIVIGKNREGIGHAWNICKVNNQWYMLDCTNSKGQLLNLKDEVDYYLFNITEEQILRVYSINNIVEIPDCNSIESDWFYKNDHYIKREETDEEILTHLQNEISQVLNSTTEKRKISLRCEDTETLERLVSLSTEITDTGTRRLYTYIGENTSISYVISSEYLVFEIYIG